MNRARLVSAAVFSVVAALASPGAAADARRAMAEGLAHFSSGNYGAAARSFGDAAAGAAAEGLDPAVALYDVGCALLQAGKGAEAAAALAEALRTADPGLAGRANYNRGLALGTAAEAAEAAGRLEGAVALLDQALGSYEGAMRADPDDVAPKVNHELVARRKARLEQRMRDEQEQRGGAGQPPPPERAEEQGLGARPSRPEGSVQEMLPEEARTMLDAMRQRETSQRSRTRPPRGGSAPADKPW